MFLNVALQTLHCRIRTNVCVSQSDPGKLSFIDKHRFNVSNDVQTNQNLSFFHAPGEGVESSDEVVAVVFLWALQQGSTGVYHVTGQETVLKAKVDTKRLDTDIFHTEEEEETTTNHFRFSFV